MTVPDAQHPPQPRSKLRELAAYIQARRAEEEDTPSPGPGLLSSAEAQRCLDAMMKFTDDIEKGVFAQLGLVPASTSDDSGEDMDLSEGALSFPFAPEFSK